MVVSFLDMLSTGETIIGTPVITVTVATGLDSNPSNILYESVSVSQGTVIEQRFRLGVVGVIYQINFSIQTTHSNTIEKDCYLAILPDDDNTVPTYLPLLETSALYPYYFSDSLQGRVTWLAGKTLGIYISDFLKTSVTLLVGTLYGSAVNYSIPHDSLSSAVQWTLGFLSGTPIVYLIPHEDMKTQVAWLTGSLYGTAVSYSYTGDNLKTSVTWTSGVLT